MATTSEFHIARMIDLYGCCKGINAMRGGEMIGCGHFTITLEGPRWFVSACGFDAVVETQEEAELMLRQQVSAADALNSRVA